MDLHERNPSSPIANTQPNGQQYGYRSENMASSNNNFTLNTTLNTSNCSMQGKMPTVTTLGKQADQLLKLKVQLRPSQNSGTAQTHDTPSQPYQYHMHNIRSNSTYNCNTSQGQPDATGPPIGWNIPKNQHTNGQQGSFVAKGDNIGRQQNPTESSTNSENYENYSPTAPPIKAIPSAVNREDPDKYQTRYNITPEYTRITTDLASRMNNYPQFNVVPFNLQRDDSTTIGKAGTGKTFSGNDYHWKWNDPAYVQLPFSPLFQLRGNNSKAWDVIANRLLSFKEECENGRASVNLDAAMASVVTDYCFATSQTNFGMLNSKDLTNDLVKTIPLIVDWALKLPALLGGPIPNLYCGDNKTIFLTRKFCCSLLANAFFCTFPEAAGNMSSRGGSHSMPDFNFLRLFNDTQTERCKVKKEKIKCLLNYFLCCSKMNENEQNQIVSFERKCVRQRINWEQSSQRLVEVLVETRKNIEEAEGFLQCDFANKVIGGGVLNEGSAMEEIRFCISPELIVSRLFMEAMDDDEAIVITGSKVFSRYTGYSTTFKFQGDFQERMPSTVDNLGRTLTQIVAIDALNFSHHDAHKQFQQKYVERDLHKCYVGFFHGKNFVSPVATGNWGCGVFNGNPELKFFIQLLAASQQERKRIQYHAVGDQRLEKAIQEMMDLLQQKRVEVRQLHKIITQFNGHQSNGSVFQFVHDSLNGRREGGRGVGGSSGGNVYKNTNSYPGRCGGGSNKSGSGGAFDYNRHSGNHGNSHNRGGSGGHSGSRGKSTSSHTHYGSGPDGGSSSGRGRGMGRGGYH